jgi:hypothetical protein
VVSEDDPLIRAAEVAAVLEALGGGRAQRIEREDFRGDEAGVETIADRVGARRGDDQPHGIDRFAAGECDGCERECAEQGDGDPDQ